MDTIKLTSRNQTEFQNPTFEQIEKVVHELYSTSDPEHPNCWITYGFNSEKGWSLITVDAYESGLILFEYWEDQDDDDPILEQRLNGNKETIINLFKLVSQKEIEKLKDTITRK